LASVQSPGVKLVPTHWASADLPELFPRQAEKLAMVFVPGADGSPAPGELNAAWNNSARICVFPEHQGRFMGGAGLLL